MKWRQITLAVLLLMGLPGRGATLFQFDVWMRQIDRYSSDLQHALLEQDSQRARLRAESLQTLYAAMAAYLDETGKPGAAKLSRDDVARSQYVLTALDESNWTRASELAVGIRQACMPCHDQYRPINE
ncbi:hypothetical protein KSF73_14215 [Burkholderiaceae bacterium DAT-1]|nr:hypothetical protein [Burkholderiaceae bacterium DAT-1]